MRIDTLIKSLNTWWDKVAGKATNAWCTLGLDKPITSENIRKYFDRTDVNKEFVDRASEFDLMKKKDHITYAAEINYIYGFSKAFAARHRTRLQLYADDWANKQVRTQNAVAIGYANFKWVRQKGEQLYSEKKS